MTTAPTWTLLIHGGAGVLTPETLTDAQQAGARAGLSAALDAGGAILAQGGTAIEAVEAAVAVLEDDPHFNAGRGAVLTRDGTVSLDAAIMDGRTHEAGSVAGVGTVRNPVRLAKAVLMTCPHVMLSGAGAEQFASAQGVEPADDDWLILPERRVQLDAVLASVSGFDSEMKYGTVGAVACDIGGHVAAATSTGGITGKRWGRIGDTPLIGAGTWADDRGCAVSATGWGEYFIRLGTGHAIDALIRHCGTGPLDAAKQALRDVSALGGTGGVIVVTPEGEGAWHFIAPGMFRGRIDATGRREVAIFEHE